MQVPQKTRQKQQIRMKDTGSGLPFQIIHFQNNFCLNRYRYDCLANMLQFLLFLFVRSFVCLFSHTYTSHTLQAFRFPFGIHWKPILSGIWPSSLSAALVVQDKYFTKL